jgi:TonB family protein
VEDTKASNPKAAMMTMPPVIARLIVSTILLGVIAVQAGTTVTAQDASKTRADGVSVPQPVKQVQPVYTREAQSAGIEGTVRMEAIVEPDGKVGNVTIVKSLDSQYGLDQEAIKALKQWLFKPGTKAGKPVAVSVTVEMSFTLKKK